VDTNYNLEQIFALFLHVFIWFYISLIFIARYSEKIAKLADHIHQIGLNATKLCEDEFNVINHGDCHANNLLFKYDNNGKPIDQIFVSIKSHKKSYCTSSEHGCSLIYYSHDFILWLRTKIK